MENIIVYERWDRLALRARPEACDEIGARRAAKRAFFCLVSRSSISHMIYINYILYLYDDLRVGEITR